MHTSKDDYLINTLRFVFTREEIQIYGAILPESMTSPEMKETKAYKTYLGFATRATPPKKAQKFKNPASLMTSNNFYFIASFILQFLKELQENTFSSSDNKDANEHIEKALEIVDLFHVPKITVDHLMLRVFPISLTGAGSRWLRNEPTAWERFKELLVKCPRQYLTEMQETAEDAKKVIQEMVEYSQKWHNGTSRGRSTETSDGLAAI
ncbi:hypothetical protein Tco_0846624 [Tanacetum coccineum]